MIPDNEYCAFCGGITKYNCKTIMCSDLDCKCGKVYRKYNRLEQQERAREMKHDWEFIKLDHHPLSQPIASYVCRRCGVEAEVHLKHTSTLVDILGEDDCKGKKVDNSPGAMLDRASDKLYGNTFIEGDLRYILDCIITSCMLISNRTKDD